MAIGKHDKLIPLSAVPMILVSLTGVFRGKGTVYKWTRGGGRSIDGRIVILETTRRLGQIFTTRQAIKDFIEDIG